MSSAICLETMFENQFKTDDFDVCHQINLNTSRPLEARNVCRAVSDGGRCEERCINLSSASSISKISHDIPRFKLFLLFALSNGFQVSRIRKCPELRGLGLTHSQTAFLGHFCLICKSLHLIIHLPAGTSSQSSWEQVDIVFKD